MTLPEKAIDKLRRLMADGKHAQALRLAASWPRLGNHRDAIRTGAAALTSPDVYRSMGRNPDELAAAGLAAIRERYDIPESGDA